MFSGRGLCDDLITRPEESYRLRRVVVCDLETSELGGHGPLWADAPKANNVGREISVGIATRYGLEGPGIESR